jgi:murein DD-endopeptidase MepM/ murein hydrolase activator NlpD
VAAGGHAVVYVWVSLGDGQVPRALRHRIDVQLGEARRELAAESARAALLRAPKTIEPPLRGSGWLAANGPSNSSGHRRTIIAVDSVARVPQRFAMDWLQVRPDGSRYQGDAKENRNYRAYGQQALAVADGIVSAVKDGIPENIPGPTSRAVPITMDTIGGNHVILGIGDGAYAFYAHLQPGSIRVKLGDKIRRGEVVGLVGNSGNSTEPHLHFHVSDANSPLGGEGIPYALTSFEVEGRIASLQGGMSWTPLATPEPRTLELPLENMIVRFPGEPKP